MLVEREVPGKRNWEEAAVHKLAKKVFRAGKAVIGDLLKALAG